MSAESAKPTSGSRQIRVFISSTFRDMMQERDLLVKRVFPELRRKCAQRFVTFTEVDLRWGITEQQAHDGQVLPLCLAEIERSRPYFLGLLGERYGWIPDSIRPEIIEREPWLNEHVAGRTSVTELEILHGVLNDPQMVGQAYFYFRDPAYLDHLPMGADRADFEPEDAASQARLAALKERIRAARDDNFCQCHENYADPDTVCQWVLDDLTALIDRLYPESEMPDRVTQDRLAHLAYASQKLFACIDRPNHLAALNEFAAAGEHGGQGLVVTGESGGGKTALLAAWASGWATRHADEFLFQHYFGAAPESASPVGFLQRLLSELKLRFDFTDDIPSDPEKLREALPLWLAQTIGRGQIVLVLDGLNQVQGDEPDRRLRFLPRHFPPHVTVLASALPGPALDALRERGWTEHELPLADQTEVDAMVAEYLRIHGRLVDVEGHPLDTELRRQLVAAPGSRNPLFLRTVLEELRQFGSFEELPERVAHYLEAEDPRELFVRVLRRWQVDFDGHDASAKSTVDLVRLALSRLWAARQGLTEPEWLDLLGEQDEPLPRAFWSPLFFALEPHLVQRQAGLFAFGHDFLRQAVEAEYLASTESQRAAHLAIADYFEKHAHQREMTPRKAAEWPYQLHAVASFANSDEALWDRLEACLTDMPLFDALSDEKTKWELTGYWHPLRHRGRDMGEGYITASEQWIASAGSAHGDLLNSLGQFLLDNGQYPAAETLLRRALVICQSVYGSSHPNSRKCLANLASVLHQNGDLEGAELLFRRMRAGVEAQVRPTRSTELIRLNNFARLLMDRGKLAEAEPLLKQVVELSGQSQGPQHIDTIAYIGNLAGLLVIKGDHANAARLLRQVLQVQEHVLGPEHPHTLTTLGRRADLLQRNGDHIGAESLLRQVVDASTRVLGPEHPSTLAHQIKLAESLFKKGDSAAAESLLRQLHRVCEQVLGPEHPHTASSQYKLAGVLMYRNGEYEEAETLLRGAVKTREKVLGRDHPNTIDAMIALAALLHATRNYVAARSLYEQTIASRERTLGPENPETLESLCLLADLMQQMGADDTAESLYRKILEARVRALGSEHITTLATMNSLGELLRTKGNYSEAELLHRRTLKARKSMYGAEHIDTLTSANNLAAVLYAKRDLTEAESLYRHVLDSRERILGKNHPDTLTCTNNLAALLNSSGRNEEAEAFYRSAFKAYESTGQLDHPSVLPIMNNLASLLLGKGDYVEAETFYRNTCVRLLKASAASRSFHPHLHMCVNNYAFCLHKLGHSHSDITTTVEAMARSFGISLSGGGGRPGGS